MEHISSEKESHGAVEADAADPVPKAQVDQAGPVSQPVGKPERENDDNIQVEAKRIKLDPSIQKPNDSQVLSEPIETTSPMTSQASVEASEEQQASQVPRPEPRTPHEELLSTSLNLRIGDRLFVAWDVVSRKLPNCEAKEGGRNEHEQPREAEHSVVTEEDITEHCWWGCELVEITSELFEDKEHLVAGPLCTLRYEPYEEFAEQECRVVFVDENEVFDLDTATKMQWSRDNTKPENMEDPLIRFAEREHGPVTMVDVLKFQKQVDEENGESLEEAGTSAFRELPFMQQQVMATQFRDFADFIKRKLEELVQTKGVDYAVTDQDIQKIIGGLKGGFESKSS